MTVRVLFFAALAERVGRRELALPLGEGATVGDAVADLAERFPALREHLPRVATAVGLGYVSASHPLRDGDELALIPPVSGG